MKLSKTFIDSAIFIDLNDIRADIMDFIADGAVGYIRGLGGHMVLQHPIAKKHFMMKLSLSDIAINTNEVIDGGWHSITPSEIALLRKRLETID